jgi:LTXXQ motif family protein
MTAAQKFLAFCSAVILLGSAFPSKSVSQVATSGETRLAMDDKMSQPGMSPGMKMENRAPMQGTQQPATGAAPAGATGMAPAGMESRGQMQMPGMQQPQQTQQPGTGMGQMGMQAPTAQQMQMMPMPMMMMNMQPGQPMSQGMPQRGMSDGSMSSGMLDRIEGRIAFLQAELRISNAQASQWTAFAAALRTNAQRMKTAQAGSLTKGTDSSAIAGLLDQRERTLTAYLDGVRNLRSAYVGLYAVLDDAQKKAAEELVWPHFGL